MPHILLTEAQSGLKVDGDTQGVFSIPRKTDESEGIHLDVVTVLKQNGQDICTVKELPEEINQLIAVKDRYMNPAAVGYEGYNWSPDQWEGHRTEQLETSLKEIYTKIEDRIHSDEQAYKQARAQQKRNL